MCINFLEKNGLDCTRMDRLLELGIRYISLLSNEEKRLKINSRDKNDLDISKCEGLIRSSFKFDYKYDPYELEYLHWYDFYNDLANLSTSEFGNCCILNRIVDILNQDPSKIKNNKDRQKLVETQEMLREKYCISVEQEMTDKQRESAEAFYKAMNWK